jgi:hypothetical protein
MWVSHPTLAPGYGKKILVGALYGRAVRVIVVEDLHCTDPIGKSGQQRR